MLGELGGEAVTPNWQRSVKRFYRDPREARQGALKWLLAPHRSGLGRVVGGLGARPSFFIIGTQKGGSTSLYRYLTDHPEVCPAALKEIHYFSYHPTCPELWYRAHFAPARLLRAKKLQTGEASVSYLHVPAAPARLAAFTPAAKLIVMLRDPVSRAFSHYQMSVKQGRETLPFRDAVALEPERLRRERELLGAEAAFREGLHHRYHSYLLRGHYAEQLERWFAHFPREQVLILSSEAFFKNPGETYREALEFLDLSPVELPIYAQHNRGKQEGSALSARLREQLGAYFEPHQARLEQLIGTPSTPAPSDVPGNPAAKRKGAPLKRAYPKSQPSHHPYDRP